MLDHVFDATACRSVGDDGAGRTRDRLRCRGGRALFFVCSTATAPSTMLKVSVTLAVSTRMLRTAPVIVSPRTDIARTCHARLIDLPRVIRRRVYGSVFTDLLAGCGGRSAGKTWAAADRGKVRPNARKVKANAFGVFRSDGDHGNRCRLQYRVDNESLRYQVKTQSRKAMSCSQSMRLTSGLPYPACNGDRERLDEIKLLSRQASRIGVAVDTYDADTARSRSARPRPTRVGSPD